MRLGEFTFATYREIVARVADGRANLCFGDFADAFDPPESFFLLRHDVDFSPQSALEMAREEARVGVRATYFLPFSSEYHNLLDGESIGVPRELVDLGHEVGLHYDVSVLSRAGSASALRMLDVQAGILELLCGVPVRSIAMHNPSIHGNDPIAGDAPYVSAYEPRFTREIAYLSDSCGAWRDEAARMLTERTVPDRLQLLVHPIFWTARPVHRSERLRSVSEGATARIDRTTEWVAGIWARHAGVGEHDAREARLDRPLSG